MPFSPLLCSIALVTLSPTGGEGVERREVDTLTIMEVVKMVGVIFSNTIVILDLHHNIYRTMVFLVGARPTQLMLRLTLIRHPLFQKRCCDMSAM